MFMLLRQSILMAYDATVEVDSFSLTRRRLDMQFGEDFHIRLGRNFQITC